MTAMLHSQDYQLLHEIIILVILFLLSSFPNDFKAPFVNWYPNLKGHIEFFFMKFT